MKMVSRIRKSNFCQSLFFLISTLSFLTSGLDSAYIYLPDKIIQEEISIGSLLVDISDEIAKYQLSQKAQDNQQQFSPQDHQQYTFLDDHKSSKENTYFLLDSVTGRVTSKRYLDRESMCMNKHCLNTCEMTHSFAYVLNNHASEADKNKAKPINVKDQNKGNCNMNLKILVIPSYNIVSLNIIIQDINDNKPQFRIDAKTESVPENVPIGYKIPVDFAYDPDVGLNSIQYYSLIQSDLLKETFELIYGETQLFIVVKQNLDRELISQYNLSISACDGGIPSNCGILKLTLNIGDINDNNPVFPKSVYTFSILENQKTGSVIGHIHAVDADEGLNGQIRYAIIGSNPNSMEKNNLLKYFNLDPNTGLLILKNSLDYEDKQFFSFTIEAKDGGVGSLPAYTQVEIVVVDVNDNLPEISVSFLNTLSRNVSETTSIQNVYINENYDPNKFLAHVTVSDRDLGAKLQWQVLINEKTIMSSDQESQAYTELIAISLLNSNSFTINTGSGSKTALDREKMPTIKITIESWDVVDPFKKSVYIFMLHLLDLNDNAPTFDRPSYDLSISENNQIGDIIYQFKAVDLDIGLNGQVLYGIMPISKPDNNSYFVTIETNTGILRAAKRFDREVQDKYEFIVVARDTSLNGDHLQSQVKCTLSIADENDNVPEISYENDKGFRESANETHLVLSVDENIPVLTELVRFSCKDLDSGHNGRTVQQLVSQSKHDYGSYQQQNLFIRMSSSSLNTNEIPFNLSADGSLFVTTRLDREQTDSYTLTLMCQDQAIGNKALNRTVDIQIKLKDVNDNCPRSLSLTDSLDDKEKTRYVSKDKVLSSSEISAPLFVLEYTDADVGENGELSFELLTHRDTFVVETMQNKMVYTMKLRFNFNETMNTNRQAFIEQLKLGSYSISVKISDNGFPSCIKTDTFRLYLGNKHLATSEILLKHLSEVFRNPEDAIIHYVNDKEAYIVENSNFIQGRFNRVQQQSRNGTISQRRSFLSIFTKNDYIILLSLIGMLVLASAFLSIIGCVYFLKSSEDDKRMNKLSKKKMSELKKARKYCEIEVNDSSINTSNSQDDDDNSQTEINNLLEHDAILNRYSTSLKSSNPEQSTSADSVLMTISNTSQNEMDDQQIRPKSQIYNNMDTLKSHHSTFTGQKYQRNSQSTSFKPNSLSPKNSSEQNSETNVPLLNSFPNPYTLGRKTVQQYHQQQHQQQAQSKNVYHVPVSILKNNHSPYQSNSANLRHSHHNEALSTTDSSEIIIMPSSVSGISSPATSTSASSESENYYNSNNKHASRIIHVSNIPHENRIKYNDLKQLQSSSEDDTGIYNSQSSNQGSVNNMSLSRGSGTRTFLRSSAV